MLDDHKQQIQIKFSDELLSGAYSNQMMVRHTGEEFVLDFFNFIPGDPQATVVARVLLSPGHAKRSLMALQENLKKFEEHFGEIKLQSQPASDGSNTTTGHSYGFDTNKAE